MKIPNCHDCGGRPEVNGIIDGRGATVTNEKRYYCRCRFTDGDYSLATWNAIQRRKRMQKKWEIIVAECGCSDGLAELDREDAWLEKLLAHFFGPADGVEVDDA